MNTTVYYEMGQVVKMYPAPTQSYYEARGTINEATLIVSDGVPYDLTIESSIRSIKVPKYTTNHPNKNAAGMGATGYLEYVLRMHAGYLWTIGAYDLAISCLEKACQLMVHSTLGWERRDYFRIVDWCIEMGQFKRAWYWEKWIANHTEDPANYPMDAFERALNMCRNLHTDLVEVGECGACCATCAKYRNRIYSISGRSWKFPHFPDDFHFQCGLHIAPFIDKVSVPTFRCRNYVLYSRRPFRDDRTPEEKERYVGWVEKLENEQQRERRARLNRVIYYWFKPKFPNDFPKSLSAFSRMRNENSAKYQNLLHMIESAGYAVPQSLEDAARWSE